MNQVFGLQPNKNLFERHRVSQWSKQKKKGGEEGEGYMVNWVILCKYSIRCVIHIGLGYYGVVSICDLRNCSKRKLLTAGD